MRCARLRIQFETLGENEPPIVAHYPWNCVANRRWLRGKTLVGPSNCGISTRLHAGNMTAAPHNKILGIGFAAFAAILVFTFLLLVVVTVATFIGLGIGLANETGDSRQAGIGILGAVFTLIFYGVLGLIFVLPTALAGWKMLKGRPRARFWGIAASIVLLVIFPIGTMLGVYGLWFFFSDSGERSGNLRKAF